MPVTTRAIYDNLTFQQNTLNKYDSVDYRLRLSLLRAQDATTYDPSKGIVLAESATTSRFILTDLELTQTYSLSPNARTAFGVKGVITIIDPSGLRFMDALVQTGASLGIKNSLLNGRILIEVEFVGQAADDSKPTLENARGMYIAAVQTINCRLTEKGGEWKITFAGLDSDAFKHVNVTLQKTKTIEHSGHIKDFVKKLEVMLNEEEKLKVGRGEQQYPNEWHFVLEDFIAGSPHFIFTGSDPNMQRFTDRTGKPMSGNDGQLSSTREGSTILQVLDNAFADTKAMKYGLNQDNTLSDPLEITTKDKAIADAKKIKQMYRIDIMVELDSKWDSITNDYVKKFYYYMFLQDCPQWFYGPVNQINDQEWSEVVKVRLANAAYTNNLRKRYDYYYTGINTEILKFELNITAGLFIAEHLLRQYSSGSGTAPGPNATVPPGSNAQQQTPGGVNAQPPTNSIGQRLTYAEQYITTSNTGNKNSDQSSQGGGTGGSNMSFPHLYSYDNAATDKSPTDLSPDQRRRMKFEHVYDRLEYTGPDFSKVAITVRGDPYWFGRTKPVIEKGGSGANTNGLETYNKDRADFFYGQQKFYLEVDVADYSEQTAEGLINTTRAVTGVYIVQQCTNRFVGGRFEQELVGVRDIMSDGPAMWDAIQRSKTVQG